MNKLSIKNKIKEVNWSNGYYGSENSYDYKDSIKTTINSKVAMPSIGDIILNDESNYFIMTGTKPNGILVYMKTNNGKITTKSVTRKSKIVPTLSIDKELLKEGTGTKDDPYIIK